MSSLTANLSLIKPDSGDKLITEFVAGIASSMEIIDDVPDMLGFIATTPGDILYRGGADVVRLALGARGSMLAAGATYPAWLAKGTRGSILAAGADDPAWLALGTTNYLLRAGATDPAWGLLIVGDAPKGGGAIATNLAWGLTALNANTTGLQNIAVGQASLEANTTGSYNIAVGWCALLLNTTGVKNVAIGVGSLDANTIGTYNTAIGHDTLTANTTGAFNTAIGGNALKANTMGVYNTAVGIGTLQANTTGIQNTALGMDAGNAITTGSNLTCLGYNTQASAVDATNEITLGNTSVATLRCQVTTITAISDRRDKTDIQDLPLGLDFLKKLKPRQFQWAMRKTNDDGSFGEQEENGRIDIGFISQELDEVEQAANVDWLGLAFKANPDRMESNSGKLFPVAIKAIQELSAMVEELQAKVVALEAA